MTIKKIVFLFICVCAIIGSTFILNTDKTSNLDDEKNSVETTTYVQRIQEEPSNNYETYTDLKYIDFIYPSDITKDNDVTKKMMYYAIFDDGTIYEREKPSERICFSKNYGIEYIFIDVSCYYKNESTNPRAHYFEESTNQVLTALLEEGISAKSGDDFVSYIESYDTYNKTSKYYIYEYISPGEPEIRAHIRYDEIFKKQFDSYIEEFEKTIKRKEIE